MSCVHHFIDLRPCSRTALSFPTYICQESMRMRLTKAILPWLLFRWRRHDTPAWSCSTWFWNVIGQHWLLWSGAFISRYLIIVIRRSAYSIAVVRLFKPCRRGAWLWIDKNSICESRKYPYILFKVSLSWPMAALTLPPKYNLIMPCIYIFRQQHNESESGTSSGW